MQRLRNCFQDAPCNSRVESVALRGSPIRDDYRKGRKKNEITIKTHDDVSRGKAAARLINFRPGDGFLSAIQSAFGPH